jgi:hypothetical protein
MSGVALVVMYGAYALGRMDADVATTLITSLAGLGGVTIGAVLNEAAQARERRRRDADELRVALADTVHVLEGFAFELRMQPRQRPRMRRVSDWLSRTVPELDLPMRELGITLAAGPFLIWVVSPQ